MHRLRDIWIRAFFWKFTIPKSGSYYPRFSVLVLGLTVPHKPIVPTIGIRRKASEPLLNSETC
jgi:hypothetical protein